MTDTEVQFPARAHDELSDREKKFIEAWLHLQEEDTKRDSRLSEGQLAAQAAEVAGWPPGAEARKAGWRLIRSRKITQALTQTAGAEIMAAKILAVRKILQIQEMGTGGTALKAAMEVLAMNADLKKIAEVVVSHEIEASGEALNRELEAALARRGLTVVNGGVLEGKAVEVRPALRLEGRNRVEGLDTQHVAGGDEASAKRLHSRRGPGHVLKPQRPDRPRRGRPPKKRLTPRKEVTRIMDFLDEVPE